MAMRLVVVCALVIAACGGGSTAETAATTASTTSTAATTTATTSAPTTAPTTTTTLAPTTLATAPSTTTIPAPIPCPTGVLGPELDEPDSLEAILDRGVVRVAIINADFPPFISCDRTGEYIGLEADVARFLIGSIFGDIEIAWIPMSSADRFNAATEGRVDIAVRVTTITPDREKLVDFATPYLMDGVAVMVPGATGVTLDDLNGMRIAIPTGTGFETRAVDRLASEGIVYEAVGVPLPASDAVSAGDADAYVAAWSQGVTAAQDQDLAIVPLVFDEQLAAFVARGQGDLLDAIERAMSEMLDSGVWAAFFEDAFLSAAPWTIDEMTAG